MLVYAENRATRKVALRICYIIPQFGAHSLPVVFPQVRSRGEQIQQFFQFGGHFGGEREAFARFRVRKRKSFGVEELAV